MTNFFDFLTGNFNPNRVKVQLGGFQRLLATTGADLRGDDLTDRSAGVPARDTGAPVPWTPSASTNGTRAQDIASDPTAPNRNLGGSSSQQDEEDRPDHTKVWEQRVGRQESLRIRTLAERHGLDDLGEAIVKSVWDHRERPRKEEEFDPVGLKAGVPVRQQLINRFEVTPRGLPLGKGRELTRIESIAGYFEATPSDRAYYQRLLLLSGYEAEEPLYYGGLQDKSYGNSWKQAVRDAASQGMSVMEYLRQQVRFAAEARQRMGTSSGGGGSSSGPKRPPLQLISDEDAAEVIEETARRTIGRVLTDDEKSIVNAIKNSIRGTQRKEQNALIDRQMAGGGETENPTAVSTLAEQGVEEELAEETAAYRTAQSFAEFVRAIGGGLQ